MSQANSVRVRITITAAERTVIREGSGAGHGIDMDLGLAHQSALKEAETDATKRALMTLAIPLDWRSTTNNSARWPLPTLQRKDQRPRPSRPLPNPPWRG